MCARPTLSDVRTDEAAPERLSRRERKVLETREAILRAACELIESEGYEEATIERIAEAADVAPRTFFRYFPNKEAVLFAEFDAARAAMLDALRDHPRDVDVLEALASVLKRVSLEIDRRWDEFSWVREITSRHSLTLSHDRIIASQEVNAQLAEVIAERMEVDPAADPRPTAWAKSIMAAFGQAVLLGPHASPSGRTFDLFLEVLGSTIAALGRLQAAASAIADEDLAPLTTEGD